jgi:hypothetical protein
VNEVPYFKALRSVVAKELLAANPNAYILLLQIAWRAQRTGKFNRYELEIGEALVGDYKEIGLTESKYRTAKKFLKKHGFATFKGTRNGTIATLTNFEVFDPNLECDNGLLISQATNEQRAANDQVTTTKNDKNDKNDKNANNYYLDRKRPPATGVGQGKDKLKQIAKPLQAQPQERKVMSPEEHENISKMIEECKREMQTFPVSSD